MGEVQRREPDLAHRRRPGHRRHTRYRAAGRAARIGELCKRRRLQHLPHRPHAVHRFAGQPVHERVEGSGASARLLHRRLRAGKRQGRGHDEDDHHPLPGLHLHRSPRRRRGLVHLPHRHGLCRSPRRGRDGPERHRRGFDHAGHERSGKPGGRAGKRQLHRHPVLGRRAGHRATRSQAAHERGVRKRRERRGKDC